MKNTADTRAQILSLFRRTAAWLNDNFCVDGREAGRIAMDSLFSRNPAFVLLLGLCPALAATTSLQNGIAMGLATAAVLTGSSLVISLLRRGLPHEIHLLSSLIIIATFTTTVDLLMQSFWHDLSESLGLYIPLIAVNCIVLIHAESFAFDNPPGKALLSSLFSGLGFTGALAILGAVREILGNGTIWSFPVPVFKDYPVDLILSPCGGFIVLGCLIALVQFIRRPGTTNRKRGDRHEPC